MTREDPPFFTLKAVASKRPGPATIDPVKAAHSSLGLFWQPGSRQHQDGLVTLTTNQHHPVSLEIAVAELQGLNNPQAEAVRKIGEKVGAVDGLGDALRGWVGPPEFAWYHRDALIALVTNRHHPVSPEIAVAVLQGLNVLQAKAVREIGEKVGALNGLGDALRGWVSPPEFAWYHLNALVALTTNEHRPVSPKIAVAVLQGLNESQAQAVKEIGEKVGALDGLGDALRGWVSPPEFAWYHRYALIALVTNRHHPVSPEIAVAVLLGLNEFQAQAVEEIGEKVGALDGLGDALRGWVSPPDFGPDHRDAFIALITEHRMTAAGAMAVIQQMNEEEVLRVCNGETPEQIQPLGGPSLNF